MRFCKIRALSVAILAVPVLIMALPEQGMAQGLEDKPRMAQARQKMDPAQRERMMQEKMDLSPEQAQEMKAIRERSMSQGKALHEQSRQKRQALMTYIKSPDANEATALRMNNELNEIQGRLGELRIKTWFEMREHLSPEQLKKMDHFPGPGGSHGPRGGMRGRGN